MHSPSVSLVNQCHYDVDVRVSSRCPFTNHDPVSILTATSHAFVPVTRPSHLKPSVIANGVIVPGTWHFFVLDGDFMAYDRCVVSSGISRHGFSPLHRQVRFFLSHFTPFRICHPRSHPHRLYHDCGIVLYHQSTRPCPPHVPHYYTTFDVRTS